MMVRMFHIACDAQNHSYNSDDLGDAYYASDAIQNAKNAGFHIKADKAICSDCWNDGVRWADIERYLAYLNSL